MSDTILRKLPMSLQTLPKRFDEEKLLADAPVFSLSDLSAVPEKDVRDPDAFKRLHADAVARYRNEISADQKLCAFIEKFSTEESFIKQLVLLSPVLTVRNRYCDDLERLFRRILLARKILFEKTGKTIPAPDETPFLAKTLPEELYDLDADIFPDVLKGMFGGVTDMAKAELTKSVPLNAMVEPDESVVATDIYYEYNDMYRDRLTTIIPAHEERIDDLNRQTEELSGEILQIQNTADELKGKLDRIAAFEKEVEAVKSVWPETMREEIGKRAVSALMNKQKIIRPPAPADFKEKLQLTLKTLHIRKATGDFNAVLRKNFGKGLNDLLTQKETIQNDYDGALDLLAQKKAFKEECEHHVQEEKDAYAAEAFSIKKDFNAALKARLAMVFAARELTSPEEAAAKKDLPPFIALRALTGNVFIELRTALPAEGVRRAADVLTAADIKTASSRAYINPEKWSLLPEEEEGGAVFLSPPVPAKEAADVFSAVLKLLRDTCGTVLTSPVVPVPVSSLLPPVNADKNLVSVRDKIIAANINNDVETLRLVSLTAEQIREEIFAKKQEKALSYEEFAAATAGCAFRRTDFLSSDPNAAFVAAPLGRIPLYLSVKPLMPAEGERCFIASYAVKQENGLMRINDEHYGVFAAPPLTPFKGYWLVDDKGFTPLKAETNIEEAAFDSYAPTDLYFLSRYPEWQKKSNA